MKKIVDFLFSMRLMSVLILIFAVAIGAATFIENDFGTPAAKAVVYNALWFELLLFLISVNLLGAMIVSKPYKKGRLSVFVFHISFLLILLGAFFTRYVGFEGLMHIRENNTASAITSNKTYIYGYAISGKDTSYFENQVLFSAISSNNYSRTVEAGGESLSIEMGKFVPNAGETVMEVENGRPIASLVILINNNRQNVLLPFGEDMNLMGQKFSFAQEPDTNAFQLYFKDYELYFSAPGGVQQFFMMNQETRQLEEGKQHVFVPRALYTWGNVKIVLEKFYENGAIDYVNVPKNNEFQLMDAIVLNIEGDGFDQEIALRGAQNVVPNFKTFNVTDNLELKIGYGSKRIGLPFSIRLRDFELDRYPGSNSPSSFASEVTLIDEEKGINEERRIFMNNVLHHRGYRFYQSSYDQDEGGTILSVNKDALGTWVTYAGYFFMTLGMILALIGKKSRFRSLVSKKAAMVVLAVALLPSLHAQVNPENMKVVPAEHAEVFGELWVQDRDGRMEPLNTLASEIVRKLVKHDSWEGQTADQVFVGMMLYPSQWREMPLFKIKHPELKSFLKSGDERVSVNDLIGFRQNSYVLAPLVESAYAKKPASQSKFDKEVIALDEKVNVLLMTMQGSFLRIFPDINSENNKWVSNARELINPTMQDSVYVGKIIPLYFSTLEKGDSEEALKFLKSIEKFQAKYGGEVLPSDQKKKIEIFYNKVHVFLNLFPVYLVIGIVLMILQLISIFTAWNLKWPLRILTALLILAFLAHTAGLAVRWYLSGHAPWSNGYESMIYIAWACMFAGIVFSRRSALTLSATSILTAVALMVAHITWMNPEITSLVPVLKSYWLTIHVAVITGSYGFFGMGFILGFMVLLLYGFKTQKNKISLDHHIKELSRINEMTMTVGLYLLTIGTFLGGIWANESWGRYWGWDPKETWALVTVLVYAFILHMRFVKGLKGNYALNLGATLSFSSVLMTYFGVNFYLSGLHSYAKGDPVPIPDFVWYSIAIIATVAIFGYINNRSINQKPESA